MSYLFEKVNRLKVGVCKGEINNFTFAHAHFSIIHTYFPIHVVFPKMASKAEPSPDLGKEEPTEQEDGAVSDPELEELLDKSLGEFGKHVQPPPEEKTPPPRPKPPPTLPPNTEAEFNEVFGEEFAAQAEAQLGEALKMMQSESPGLWKQFEEFSKPLGGQPDAASNVGGVASHGESSVDEGGVEGAGQEREESLADVLEETLQKLKEDAEGVGSGGEDDEDEDKLIKMMKGMMDSLLSRDVLYPSLQELCKQYPDWLREHKSELSPEDHQRYSRQLEIMTTICEEFEGQGDKPTQASSDRILSLMQQLQQYGQPPAELSTDSEGAGLLPPGAGDMNPQNCSLM